MSGRVLLRLFVFSLSLAPLCATSDATAEGDLCDELREEFTMWDMCTGIYKDEADSIKRRIGEISDELAKMDTRQALELRAAALERQIEVVRAQCNQMDLRDPRAVFICFDTLRTLEEELLGIHMTYSRGEELVAERKQREKDLASARAGEAFCAYNAILAGDEYQDNGCY